MVSLHPPLCLPGTVLGSLWSVLVPLLITDNKSCWSSTEFAFWLAAISAEVCSSPLWCGREFSRRVEMSLPSSSDGKEESWAESWVQYSDSLVDGKLSPWMSVSTLSTSCGYPVSLGQFQFPEHNLHLRPAIAIGPWLLLCSQTTSPPVRLFLQGEQDFQGGRCHQSLQGSNGDGPMMGSLPSLSTGQILAVFTLTSTSWYGPW